MNKILNIALISTGITLVLFASVTLRTDVSFVDGPPLSFYGFPFPYIRFSQVSSLDYVINFKSLAIDFFSYFALVLAVVSSKKVYGVLSKKWWLTSVIIFSLAIVPIGFVGISTFNSGDLSVVGQENGRVRSIHFGYSRPYHPPSYHDES